MKTLSILLVLALPMAGILSMPTAAADPCDGSIDGTVMCVVNARPCTATETDPVVRAMCTATGAVNSVYGQFANETVVYAGELVTWSRGCLEDGVCNNPPVIRFR